MSVYGGDCADFCAAAAERGIQLTGDCCGSCVSDWDYDDEHGSTYSAEREIGDRYYRACCTHYLQYDRALDALSSEGK